MNRQRLRPVGAALSALLLLLARCPNAGADVILPPVWHWSNPTPSGADIFALARSAGNYVQAGEAGQIFTSSDLSSNYWSAQASFTTASLRAATFLGGRCIIVGEAGTVLFSDDLSSFYLVDLDTSNWLESVAASSNLVVAVGDNGSIYTSTQGVSWAGVSSGITDWLSGVAYGNGCFVAVGESGFIACSTNGTDWKRVAASLTAKNLNWVAWQGNQFMAVGDEGVTVASTTGTNSWHMVTSGATNSLYADTGNTNDWLIAGDSELWIKDSSTWSDQLSLSLSNPAPAWTYFASVWSTNTSNAFVVAGETGMTAIGSKITGGFSWHTPSPSVRSWLWQTTRMPDYYLAVGNYGTILSSPDGYDWTVEYDPAATTNAIVLLGVGGTSNLLVSVGAQGSVLAGTNAFYWTLLASVPTTNDLEGVGFDGTQFILCGDQGTILTTTNVSVTNLIITNGGTNVITTNTTPWTRASTPTSVFLTSIAFFPGRTVVVGDQGTILTSSDTITWSKTQVTTNWLSQVAYLNGALVAVGNNGTILTSYDATNWISRASGTTAWLNAVDYLGGTWFVAGNQGTVLGSPDLTNWVNFPTLTSQSLYGLAHNQGQLITIGSGGVILRSQIIPPSTPVNIVEFGQTSGQNVFLFKGQLDQQFFLDSSTNLSTWTQGPLLEFQDDTGTLLYLQNAQTNPPTTQYYRTEAVQ